MEIEFRNGTYFIKGRPARASRIKAVFPVESQRAVANWMRQQAEQILGNPKAIVAARENAKRLVRESQAITLSAELDAEKEVEWNAREVHC
jgi:hypothetical protein